MVVDLGCHKRENAAPARPECSRKNGCLATLSPSRDPPATKSHISFEVGTGYESTCFVQESCLAFTHAHTAECAMISLFEIFGSTPAVCNGKTSDEQRRALIHYYPLPPNASLPTTQN